MADRQPMPYRGLRKDLSGRRFALLRVIELDSVRKRSDGRGTKVYWSCLCDCGKTTVCESSNLLNGGVQSCGCFKFASRNATHCSTGTRLHRIWAGMKARCYNQSRRAYKDYGGRGIVVCQEWRESFDAFRDWAMANGYSDELSIDRHPDPHGNYEPSNCRWATWPEQQRNRRNTHYVTYRGQRIPLAELAERFSIKQQTLRGRLASGWNLETALSTPVKMRSA